MNGNLRFDFIKKKTKSRYYRGFFLWKLSTKIRKKSCDKCVFFIIFFYIFKKYDNEACVNLQHLVSKIDKKSS